MPSYAKPHSPQWFADLESFDPVQADHTRQIIEMADSSEVCSVCGDDPATDYKLVHPFPVTDAVATMRLCDGCRFIRELDGESFMPLKNPGSAEP
jgi:hypothetical protein